MTHTAYHIGDKATLQQSAATLVQHGADGRAAVSALQSA